jgi:RNA polymerase-binding transcription factor DksA
LGGLLRLERARVVDAIAGLRRSLEEIVEAAAGANLDDEHDPEGATVGFERAQVTKLLADAEVRLEEIDAALERIRSDTYGTCASCGRAISRERLEVRPAATLCVSCASRRDSRP